MAEVSFGEWLKRRRSVLGLTQEQLAQQIHCSTSALRKFEAEERRPSAEVVRELADIFNVPPEEHESFLRFARGDWQAFGGSDKEDAPWRLANVDQHSNLPSSITSFIGRGKEQDEVINLLKKNRLVTITGIGGIGKTRLALQVGKRLLSDYPHGVWFVSLDSLSDPSLVPQTVAAVFHVRESTSQPILETLKTVLRQKTLLLIIDNCEHLLDACRLLIVTLFAHCPNVIILTTSREILNIEGEATYSLQSLSSPEGIASPKNLAEYESVQLFLERAALALSTFQLTSENAPSIVDICRRVDGIPLAIELTAARVNILSVAEISKQLQKSFSILVSDHRTTLSRHQTLQASLDWSWSLLTDSERVFMRQLSVFAGGCTLQSAEAVCDGDTLSLASALVQKSLIRVEQAPARETRYHLHEMVHQYAHEKLLESLEADTISDRHLAYFVKLVEQAEPELYRSKQVIWLNRLEDEIDNFRTAFEWALVNDVELGLQIAVAPWRFWDARGYFQEIRDWLLQLLERYDAVDLLHVQALAIASFGNFRNGNFREAISLAEQSLRMARALSDKPSEAVSLSFLGLFILLQGDVDDGLPLLEQSLAIYRELGDKIGQAESLDWLSISHADMNRATAYAKESLELSRELGHLSGITSSLTELARLTIWSGELSSPAPWLEEAVLISRQISDRTREGWAIVTRGVLAYWQGDYQRAKVYFEDAIVLCEKVGDNFQNIWAQIYSAYAILRLGDIQQARTRFAESIRNTHTAGMTVALVFALEGLASLYVNQNQLERAIRLFAWTDVMREQIGDQRPPVEQASVDKDLAVIHSILNEETFVALYAQGEAMTTEQAISLATEKSSS